MKNLLVILCGLFIVMFCICLISAESLDLENTLIVFGYLEENI